MAKLDEALRLAHLELAAAQKEHDEAIDAAVAAGKPWENVGTQRRLEAARAAVRKAQTDLYIARRKL
jgi:hypothetical protein